MPRIQPSSQLTTPHPDAQSFVYNVTGEYREPWRVFRIIAEFVEGYQFLGSFTREVTVLGSARIPTTSQFGKEAYTLGKLLGKGGYTTITGGGPGIMEATNKGAFEAGGESVGLNIQLPFEQRINPYVKKSTAFYYFITRKVMLTSPSQAFVCFPGGFGTLDEFFEIVDMMELGFMTKTPVILVGRAYWEPVFAFLHECSMKKAHAIEKKNLEMCTIVDTAKEAYEIIQTTKDIPNVCELDPTQFGCQGQVNWRIFRILAELVEGFEFLTGLVDDVTILGTKSIPVGDRYYTLAEEIARLLAEQGFSIVTGGGPGIMEAANKGARAGGGPSIGINTRIDHRERINEYVDRSIAFSFPFTRKFILISPSKAFIFFPGGFGTMHELFEVLTLMQTGKMERVPVILMGSDFWGPLVEFIEKKLAGAFGTISRDNAGLFKVLDESAEAVEIIKRHRKVYGGVK